MLLNKILFYLTKPIFLELFPKTQKNKYYKLKYNFVNFYNAIPIQFRIKIVLFIIFIHTLAFFLKVFFLKDTIKTIITFFLKSKIYILISGINLLKNHSIILQYSNEN